jgi:hypothetical protein
VQFEQLFLQNVAASYDKQMALSDLIGDSNWQFDMDSQTLSFGSKFRFKIQVLGTESNSSNTWLWGWANEASGIPPSMLKASEELRALGVQEQVSELTQAEIPLTDQVNGHTLSMIASGVCKGQAYYRGPYDGGALFMLIRDENYPQQNVLPVIHISTLFPQLISNMEIGNHRQAFLPYVQFYGAKVNETGDLITAQFNDNNRIEARFMPDNRLEKLNVTAG